METNSVLSDTIGNLAVVASIIYLSSGLFVCKHIVTNKTTGDLSPLPFVSGILFSAVWLIYGHARGCTHLVQANIISLILMSGYTIVFFFYTLKKTVVMKQCSAMTLIFMFFLVTVNEIRFYTYLGYIATVFATVTVAEPMYRLLTTINTKNTSNLPFGTIMMSLVVSALWATYGILNDETMVLVVYITSTAVAGLQLAMFAIYPPVSATLPLHVAINKKINV